MMNQQNGRLFQLAGLALVLTLVLATAQVHAGQGCPFDDGSCQEYCNQQGCNMGYCGHFAWIQCICRKCGDEWSWYDKVRYNPDKTVNQTELDSLKLNSSSPVIIASSTTGQQVSTQQVGASSSDKRQQQQQQQETTKQQTLTTLLIPDLSDTSGKLDMNDIPDENSDKFLDYLAKNHERLAQATAQQRAADSRQEDDEQSDEDGSAEQSDQAQTSTTQNPTGADEEMIEIQISSSNNTKAEEPAEQQQQVATSSSPIPVASGSTSSSTKTTTTTTTSTTASGDKQHSPVTRLLRMAVIERALEDID